MSNSWAFLLVAGAFEVVATTPFRYTDVLSRLGPTIAFFAAGRRTFIIIDPDPENTRAVRAYQKAGFRIVSHLAGRTGDALIMQYTATGGENRP